MSNNKIPDDWQRIRFGELVKEAKNGFGRRPEGLESGYIVLRLADVATGLINITKPREVAMTPKDFEQYKIEKEDLLFIRVNGSREVVARCILVDKEYKNVAYNDHLIRVKLKSCLDSSFANYLFNEAYTRSRLLSFLPIATGSQLTINQPSLLSIKIPLPPLEEQKAIANILSTWDEAIQTVEDLIKELKQRKKALMQRLLTGKVRFPEFNDEWKEVRLGEIVAITSGNSPSNHQFNNEGNIPFIKVEELNNCSKYQVKSRFYTENKGKIIPPNNVIFPKRGAAILNNKVRINKTPIYMDSNMMALEANEQFLNHEYLYYFILFKKLFKIADTSTIPQINNKHIRPYKIKLPSLEEQQKNAKVISDSDLNIDVLERQKEKLQTQKRGLMQKLLTGQIRVKPSSSG